MAREEAHEAKRLDAFDLHPRLHNVLLVGGGSGHGFKHGPEVGRYAAATLLGGRTAEPRFSLATKALSQKREVH